jgi:SAM-dependent methyltransferase
MSWARYDGIAEWYDQEFLGDGVALVQEIVLELLGEANGRLLDVGCGTGVHTAALRNHGWEVVGLDASEDMLRLARARDLEVVQADAADLPFDDESFAAAVSVWTHTDVDDFAATVREIARVLRPRSPFVYLGAHACFIGPHSRFPYAIGVPELHSGYRQAGRYTDAPGINPTGLRAKVGAVHLPLEDFIAAFLDAGLRLERLVEPKTREYPHMIAMRWRR